jgi:capsular polysaccharide transport system permease protein
MVNGPALVPAEERAASRQNRASAQDSDSGPQPEPSSSRREIVRTPTIKQDLAREPDTALRSRTDHRMERQLSPLVAASSTVLKMPLLPQREQRRSFGIIFSFLLLVALPTLASGYYLFAIASNQYVAEFKFAVKDASASRSVQPQGMMAALGMGGVGVTSNMTDNYMVTDYLLSRQAVEELQTRIGLIGLYSKPDIDWLARFRSTDPMEKFVRYWQWMVVSDYDQITGIARAQVRAFSPDDALKIANTMLALSEQLINRNMKRIQADTVRFAQNEVERGEKRLVEIRTKLTEYRNKAGIIDPNSSLVASNSQLAQTLRANLAQLETQVNSMRALKLDDSAPAMTIVRSQIKATKEQLAAVEKSVATTGQGAALSNVVAEFEKLDVERQLAQTMLTNAQASLDQARATAASQILYVEPYVRPYLPQSALYPRRYLDLGMAFAISLVIWGFLVLTARSIREHY